GPARRHAHAAELRRRVHGGIRAHLSRPGEAVRDCAGDVPSGADSDRPQRVPGRQPAPGGERTTEAAGSRLAGIGAAAEVGRIAGTCFLWAWRLPDHDRSLEIPAGLSSQPLAFVVLAIDW